MEKRLTDFIDPRTLDIRIADLARGAEKPVEKVYTPQTDWKWAHMCLIVVEGVGGRFVSYRVLRCWMEAVIELLTKCANWQILQELIEATEWELKHYDYPDTHRQQLQVVLVKQKARLKQLREAWQWARGWERVIKNCLVEQSLNMAQRLFKEQKSQFEEYPEVLNWVRIVGRQHREYLRFGG